MVAAFGLGIYLGLPRRQELSIDEIQRKLGEDGEHAKATRHMTFFNLLQRKVEKGSERRRRQSSDRRERRPFQTY